MTHGMGLRSRHARTPGWLALLVMLSAAATQPPEDDYVDPYDERPCPRGQVFKYGRHGYADCVRCKAGTVKVPDTDTQVVLMSSKTCVKARTVCGTAEIGRDGLCTPCPASQVPRGNTRCSQCPAGTTKWPAAAVHDAACKLPSDIPPCVGRRAEVCNGKDDDCDGVVDNGFGNVTCGLGICTNTAPECVNGAPNVCVPKPPSQEVCNGLDDNCDGQVDEGLPSITCGTGPCAKALPGCVNGKPNSCVGVADPCGTDCARPATPNGLYCSHEGAISGHLDCDGDGLLDWACKDSGNARRGVVLSTQECSYDAFNPTSWPNASFDSCPHFFVGCQLPRTKYGTNDFCSVGRASENVDCDGDGILDWACRGHAFIYGRDLPPDTSVMQRGVVLSSHGCAGADTGGGEGWPNATVVSCPSVFDVQGPAYDVSSCPTPILPNDQYGEWGAVFCFGNEYVRAHIDCDGDGTLDWACKRKPGYRLDDKPAGANMEDHGVVLSSRGCAFSLDDPWVWPSAPVSSCPMFFV